MRSKGHLDLEEENKLEKWLVNMAKMRHRLNPIALKMKVCELKVQKQTSFWDGIPRGRWMRGWKQCHPELSLRMSHALEIPRTKDCVRRISIASMTIQSPYTQRLSTHRTVSGTVTSRAHKRARMEVAL